MSEQKTIYPYVLKSLQSMTTSDFDTKTITEAAGLHRYLQSSQFISAFVISEPILGFTKPLSKQLQGQLNCYMFISSGSKIF